VLRLRLGLGVQPPAGVRDVAALTGFSTRTITRIEERARALAHRIGAPSSLVAAVDLLGAEVLDPGGAAARLQAAGLTDGAFIRLSCWRPRDGSGCPRRPPCTDYRTVPVLSSRSATCRS